MLIFIVVINLFSSAHTPAGAVLQIYDAVLCRSVADSLSLGITKDREGGIWDGLLQGHKHWPASQKSSLSI